ncbi:hypothetical protein P4O66_003221 [Electrophorus voltai]|uniref:Reelin domain-containing protein n=1 Tax=Electrophorus voltai TaxID=2609070 RepID=A0AAD8YT58_9TELE|nr:hypothetical protein P4O66_003221 [Electrophorus voltai]
MVRLGTGKDYCCRAVALSADLCLYSHYYFPAELQLCRIEEETVMLRTALMAFGILASVTSYRNGKVEKVCESMVPRHGGEPNTTAIPYTLTVDTSEFSPGDHIQVTLSGSVHFEGFLIEARDLADVDGPAIGSFMLLNPAGSAVSQTSETRKTEVSVVWNAPTGAPSAVLFLATVVAHYSNFWIKIPSPVITQSGMTPPSISSTSSTSSAPETTAILLQPFSLEGCGVWKSCLQDPAGCDPSTDLDCFFLSYRVEGQSVQFELSGTTHGYVSFALSEDEWMGNDDVYLCVNNGGHVHVEAAYATGRSYPEAADKNVLSDVGWRAAGGVIQCSFRRAVDIPQEPQRFSLTHPYFLFLAQGIAQRGAPWADVADIGSHDRRLHFAFCLQERLEHVLWLMICEDPCFPSLNQGTLPPHSSVMGFGELEEKVSPVKLHSMSSFKVKCAKIKSTPKVVGRQ